MKNRNRHILQIIFAACICISFFTACSTEGTAKPIIDDSTLAAIREREAARKELLNLGEVYEVGPELEDIAICFANDITQGNFVNLQNSYEYVEDPYQDNGIIICFRNIAMLYEGNLTVDTTYYEVDGPLDDTESWFKNAGHPVVWTVTFTSFTYEDELGSYTDGGFTVMFDEDYRLIGTAVSGTILN